MGAAAWENVNYADGGRWWGSSWERANYADGPKVSAWIEQNLVVDAEDQATVRRLYEWKIGGTAQFLCVDRIMVRYARHVSELPGEVWLAKRPDRKKHKKRAEFSPPAVKWCAGCGNPIPYRKPCGDARGRQEYARMRFCSRSCSAEVLTGNPSPLRVAPGV